VGRAYGSAAIQRGSGPEVLRDEAKRLKKQGYDTVFTKQKDVGWGAVGSAKDTDYIWRLYAAPKVKKAKKGKK